MALVPSRSPQEVLGNLRGQDERLLDQDMLATIEEELHELDLALVRNREDRRVIAVLFAVAGTPVVSGLIEGVDGGHAPFPQHRPSA